MAPLGDFPQGDLIGGPHLALRCCFCSDDGGVHIVDDAGALALAPVLALVGREGVVAMVDMCTDPMLAESGVFLICLALLPPEMAYFFGELDLEPAALYLGERGSCFTTDGPVAFLAPLLLLTPDDSLLGGLLRALFSPSSPSSKLTSQVQEIPS